MSLTENSNQVFSSWGATNSQNSFYILVCPLEVEFWSELHTNCDICICKVLKRMLPKVSCKNKHGNLSLLNDFLPFQYLKIILFLDEIKKKEHSLLKYVDCCIW